MMMRQVTNRLIAAASTFSRVAVGSFRTDVTSPVSSIGPLRKRKMSSDASPECDPSKLVVRFCLPHFRFPPKAYEVDKVVVPATSGQMAILPGHAKTIAELKPGLMSVYKGSDVEKYMVGTGYAVVLPNSHASIFIFEAVELDQIDPALVQKGLTVSTQMLHLAKCPFDKAEAQIGVDVYEAINAALNG